MQGSEIKGKRREELHNKIRQLKFINKHFSDVVMVGAHRTAPDEKDGKNHGRNSR